MSESCDFLLQRTLFKKAPLLHKNINDMIFATGYAINKASADFPLFTDRSICHSLVLIDNCDRIIGPDSIEDFNADEIYILLSAAVLHDIGLSADPGVIISGEGKLITGNTHVDADSLLLQYHPDTSAYYIYKFKDFFEFPSDSHTHCIAQVVKGHHGANLSDDMRYPDEYRLDNGSIVRLRLLASILKSAEELAESPSLGSRRSDGIVRILDTDMGVDDIMAILLTKFMGWNPPDYVIVTPGNTSLLNGVNNILTLRKLFSLPFTVVMGYDDEQTESASDSFHGADGFANISHEFIDRVGMSDDELGDYMDMDSFKTLLRDAKEIEYTTIGPLGNLAAFIEDPDFNPKITRIYCMGGGINEFNCPHSCEFNFYKAPGAVRTLLKSGKDIVLFPLDITNRQRLGRDRIRELAPSSILPETEQLLTFNLNSNTKSNGIPAAVLHDTMPILYQCDPELFTTEIMSLDSDEYGSTYISAHGNPVTVAIDVAPELFFNRLRFLLC